MARGGRGGGSSTTTSAAQVQMEVKHRMLAALSKLSDRDTQQLAVEELQRMAEALKTPEGIATCLSCICDTDAAPHNSKSAAKRECVKMLGTLAMLHGAQLLPHLPKILASILRRLKDPDSAVRDACVDAIATLSSTLVVATAASASASSSAGGHGGGTASDADADADAAPPGGTPNLRKSSHHHRHHHNMQELTTFVKPFFDALSEQNRNVQHGAALCLARVISSTRAPPTSPSMARVSHRVCRLLANPSFVAKSTLLPVISSLSQIGAIREEGSVSNMVPCVHEALESSDWAIRKAAAETLSRMASTLPHHLLARFKTPTLALLHSCRFDKVKPVRDSVQDALLTWKALLDFDAAAARAGEAAAVSSELQPPAADSATSGSCAATDASADHCGGGGGGDIDSSNASSMSRSAARQPPSASPSTSRPSAQIKKKRGSVAFTDKKPNPQFFNRLAEAAATLQQPDEWHIEVAVPRRPPPPPAAADFEFEPAVENSQLGVTTCAKSPTAMSSAGRAQQQQHPGDYDERRCDTIPGQILHEPMAVAGSNNHIHMHDEYGGTMSMERLQRSMHTGGTNIRESEDGLRQRHHGIDGALRFPDPPPHHRRRHEGDDEQLQRVDDGEFSSEPVDHLHLDLLESLDRISASAVQSKQQHQQQKGLLLHRTGYDAAASGSSRTFPSAPHRDSKHHGTNHPHRAHPLPDAADDSNSFVFSSRFPMSPHGYDEMVEESCSALPRANVDVKRGQTDHRAHDKDGAAAASDDDDRAHGADWKLIHRQLSQLEFQQAAIMDLLQEFMGSSKSDMVALEWRIKGLESVMASVELEESSEAAAHYFSASNHRRMSNESDVDRGVHDREQYYYASAGPPNIDHMTAADATTNDFRFNNHRPAANGRPALSDDEGEENDDPVQKTSARGYSRRHHNNDQMLQEEEEDYRFHSKVENDRGPAAAHAAAGNAPMADSAYNWSGSMIMTAGGRSCSRIGHTSYYATTSEQEIEESNDSKTVLHKSDRHEQPAASSSCIRHLVDEGREQLQGLDVKNVVSSRPSTARSSKRHPAARNVNLTDTTGRVAVEQWRATPDEFRPCPIGAAGVGPPHERNVNVVANDKGSAACSSSSSTGDIEESQQSDARADAAAKLLQAYGAGTETNPRRHKGFIYEEKQFELCIPARTTRRAWEIRQEALATVAESASARSWDRLAVVEEGDRRASARSMWLQATNINDEASTLAAIRSGHAHGDGASPALNMYPTSTTAAVNASECSTISNGLDRGGTPTSTPSNDSIGGASRDRGSPPVAVVQAEDLASMRTKRAPNNPAPPTAATARTLIKSVSPSAAPGEYRNTKEDGRQPPVVDGDDDDEATSVGGGGRETEELEEEEDWDSKEAAGAKIEEYMYGNIGGGGMEEEESSSSVKGVRRERWGNRSTGSKSPADDEDDAAAGVRSSSTSSEGSKAGGGGIGMRRSCYGGGGKDDEIWMSAPPDAGGGGGSAAAETGMRRRRLRSSKEMYWKVWRRASEMVEWRDEAEGAYAEVLGSGDELLLVRLMHKTGPVLHKLSAATANRLLSAVALLLRQHAFFDFALPWLQQVVDLIVKMGSSCLDISMDVKIELLQSIREIGDMELPNGWAGNSVAELSSILTEAWSNEDS